MSKEMPKQLKEIEMKDLEKKFIQFIRDNELEAKYNVDEVFKYDFVKGETDFSTLELKHHLGDNHYIDGMDLYKAFIAGTEVSND